MGEGGATTSMRAAVRYRYGAPEVVKVTTVRAPEATDPDELLVRVHASTVNRTDCGYLAGTPPIIRFFSGLVRPKRPILGNEFAGVVEHVGSAVTRFAVGDRVLGYVEGPFGGHGEQLVVRQGDSIATIPDDVGFTEAAAGTEGSHYALAYLDAGDVGPGTDMMVYGATGAIGSAAVQLAEQLGATVTGVCATDQLELVRRLGADRVVDYTAGDFTEDDQRYDVVLDAVGKSSFGACKKLLKPGGLYMSTELGRYAQNSFLPLVTRFGRGKRVKFPTPTHDQAMIEHLRDLIASGDFRPVVDRVYPLDDIVEAYRYVESGQKIGNVVIEVIPGSAPAGPAG